MSSNPNIVNIVELQNVVTSASGVGGLPAVQEQVNNIAKMVNFKNKQIKTNIISKYDKVPIVVTDPISFLSAATFAAGSGNSITITSGGTGSVIV